jgi:hypothetical protein
MILKLCRAAPAPRSAFASGAAAHTYLQATPQRLQLPDEARIQQGARIGHALGLASRFRLARLEGRLFFVESALQFGARGRLSGDARAYAQPRGRE